MYKPGLDIVVVNYRTPDDLNKFCASLMSNQATVDHDLYIFNVAPGEDDLAIANDWSFIFRAESLYNTNNVGYAAAVNVSAMHGSREVIAVFNADVKITPDSLDYCYDALMANTMWGILGPRQIDSEGLITHGGIINRAHTHRGWHEDSRPFSYVDIREVPTVMGAAMFIKRSCWNELTRCAFYQDHVRQAFGTAPLGAFLPTRLYFEETFCCYHAIEHGWKVIYYGPVTMIHQWHGALKMVPQEKQQIVLDRSRWQFQAACDAVHGMSYE